MKQAFIRWIYADAMPWQFWMPMSGLLGGCIAAAVVGLVLWLVVA